MTRLKQHEVHKNQAALVQELKAENKRLHTRNAVLEVKNLSLTNRIKTLEKQIKSRADGALAQAIGQIYQRAKAASKLPPKV